MKATNSGSTILFGEDVWDMLNADKIARVPMSCEHADCFESEPLCSWQQRVHLQGFRTARLEKSALGWGVRNASGLDGFTLLASVRSGDVDGSFDAAYQWAMEWQAGEPERRIVICSTASLPAELVS